MTYLSNLIAALQEVDPDNTYFLFVPRRHAHLVHVSAPNFRIIWVSDFANRVVPSIVWHLVVYPVALRRLGVDVVHLPDCRRFPLWKPCATALTIHDVVNFEPGARLTPAKRLFYWIIAKVFVRHADVVTTVSDNSRLDIARIFGIDHDRVVVTPNGVSGDFTPRDRLAAQQRLARYDLPSRMVLCVARLEHPRKNHVTLLQAFAALRERRGFGHGLVLVGKRWEGADVIDATIAELGLTGVVRCLGYVPDADLPFFYNAAECVVYPAHYEGFGLPVVEALASGVPVVASRVASIPEIAGDAAILTPPDDPDAMAEVLWTALTDEKVRARLAREGPRRAAAFSWRRTAERTVHAYHRAAVTARAARAAARARGALSDGGSR